MNTKQRKQLRSWLGLFVLTDKALLPTTCETDAGFHIECEPVCEFDYRQRSELVRVISDAIRQGNPVISAPTPEIVKTSVPAIQARLKAKSWKEVERQSIYFSIECFDDEFTLKSWGRAPDGTWGPDKDLDLERSIPINQGVDAIVDVILDHLSQRSDLPGLPLARSA
jgi:hypothetical protein